MNAQAITTAAETDEMYLLSEIAVYKLIECSWH
jgi:hypothetical protein